MRYVLPLVAMLAATGVRGDPDVRFRQYLSMSLEELMAQKVTIATHSAQPLSQVPSVVTVISRDDIKATGATNLAEVLQTVPGIHVRHQHFGLRPLVSFRGANDKQTLVLVNGSPMPDLMWRLGIFWKGMPVSAIDRVEIIRGPGSAMYGSDASAGVINVITRTAGRIVGTEAGVRAGSFDTRTAWMQHGGEWAGFDLGFTADLSSTDSHEPFIAADAQSARDTATGSNASLAPDEAEYGYRNTDLRLSLARDHWRLMADYTRHDDLETGMTGIGALDPVTEGKDSRLELALLYDNPRVDDDWGVEAELRYRHIDYSSGDGFQEWPPGHIDGNGGLYPDGIINRMESAEQRVTTALSGLYQGIEQHAIRVGLGYEWHDLYRVEHYVNSGVDGIGNPLPAGGPLVDISDSPYAFAPEKTRNVWYLYLQDVWTLSDDWELTAGARYDHYSDFGGALSPRLALVWQTSDRLTTKLLYGQAFRAPYFQELFAETSFSLPNPDLDPERSETWELSFGFAASPALHLGANLFHFKQTDVITLPAFGAAYENSGSYSISGFEIESWWQPHADLRFAANYAYNDVDKDEFRAQGSPRQQAYVRADWQFHPDWSGNLQANWVGEVERFSGDPRPPVDDYLVADATLRFGGVRDWEFAFSVRNLLDEDARAYTPGRIPNDLALPGRSVYLEARYDFGG